MASHFYFEGEPVSGAITLTGDEAHHVTRACRHTTGDRMTGFNGDGRGFVSVLREVGRGVAVFEVVSIEGASARPAPRLTVASALPKGDRFDFLLEKLTEFNADAFVPLITRRSVVVPSADKLPKWRRAVIEACKQCGRRTLPRISEPVEWARYAASDGLVESRFLLSTGGVSPLAPADRGDILVAVGPEGGWSDEEETLALAHGWKAASLGPHVLRVETACLAAAARLA